MQDVLNKSWTLFLDRDGVINQEKENDYIHSWEEFIFYAKAAEAVAALSKQFNRVFIVTNQKGVGKGLTQVNNLQIIHENMTRAIEHAGGKIDEIYYCPDTNDDSPNRKPNPGMAFQAKSAFADIDLAKSIMVGNNLSDLYFGRNAGMKTAFVRTTLPHINLPEGLADWDAADLHDLSKMLLPLFA